MAGEAAENRKAQRKAERTFTTTKHLDKLRRTRPHRQHMVWDSEEKSLSVLVSRGPKHKRQATLTFRAVYYLPSAPGKPRYKKLGRYPDELSNLKAVRGQAAQIRIGAMRGVDPKRPPLVSGGFKEVVDRFIAEYAQPKQRSWSETARMLKLYAVPEWQGMMIEDINWREHINPFLIRLSLGKFKGPHGQLLGTPSVARLVRAHLVTLFNWYVEDHASTGFRSPIVKSSKTKEWKPPARERHLDDDEVRALWMACDEIGGAYGALVKCGLLTAQRFRKVGQMRRSELKDYMRIPGRMENGSWVADEDVPNVWDPTRDDDPKNKRVSVVPLSQLAREAIVSVPIIDAERAKDFVFTTTGVGPLKGLSHRKARLDRKMLALLRQQVEARGGDPASVELRPWQHRDLRRTARTLMARMGVSNEVAEHCLAHALATIQATYNRHGYLAEKRTAFEQLAALVERIVNPPPDNVVTFDRAFAT